MKLTIEGIFEKWVDEFDDTVSGYVYDDSFWKITKQQFTADIQEYVKQEMKAIVPEENESQYEPCNSLEVILVAKGENSCRSSILTAIDNYGKEDK